MSRTVSRTDPRSGSLAAWVRARCGVGAVLLATWLMFAPAVAAEPVDLKVDASDGYGRIVLTFPHVVPKHRVRATTGVVVVSFEDAVSVEPDRVASQMPEFVAGTRRDPDGRAVRFALVQPVTVNTTEAGERLFIDLLPKSWQGPPPDLPHAVVEELARRAEEAERRREEQERRARLNDAGAVELRIAKLPTLVRFEFGWSEPATARIERRVDRLRIVFEEFGQLDTAGVLAQLPSYISRITARNGEEGLEVELVIDPESDVRGFAEGSSYVVDVATPAPDPSDAAPSFAALPAAASQLAQFPGSMKESVAIDERPEDDGGDIGRTPPVAEATAGPDAGAAGRVSVTQQPSSGLEAEPVRVEARRFGSTARLAFPFPEPTASAVFEHGGALWLVFDSAHPLDVRGLRHDLDGIVSDIQLMRGGARSTLRLVLERPALTTVAQEQATWVVTLGDAVLASPVALEIERMASEESTAVQIGLPGAAAIHELHDPESGERLWVVTAAAPAHGIVKPRRFVDFSLRPTLHGVAVRRIADDVSVRLEESTVRIVRPDGLRLSLIASSADRPPATAGDGSARPGFVDVIAVETFDPGVVHRVISGYVREAAMADEDQRTAARLRLAQALLASDLGPEAIGKLRIVAEEDPSTLRRPDMRALRGVALTLMHRPREALAEFDMYGLDQSTDVALWRGLAEAQLGRWRAAEVSLSQGEPALTSHPVARHRMFGLTAARAALELGNPADAAARLAQLRDIIQPGDPQLALLEGRLAEMVGNSGQALKHYDAALRDGGAEIAAEARLRSIVTRHQVGELSSASAIEALESLSLAWRGDNIELKTLHHLAGLHVATGNSRRAFELMKSATIVNPESQITRALQDDMNRAFEALFLEGGADDLPPLEALALYYDFRELTPVGRKGDSIIRWLADRLVEVDLLDQAAELLSHQLEHRLSGAARAEAAAQLALIHLMRGQPARALTVLARTRQAVLPRELNRQRMLLEARALGQTGRAELALDILERFDGDEVERLRADTQWRAENWQAAGESYESLLGERWHNANALDEQAQHDVVRTAVAYALAEDNLALERLGAKFADQMAESEMAGAFAAVTGFPARGAGGARDLVREIAGLDTLDAFLAEYRARYGSSRTEDAPHS